MKHYLIILSFFTISNITLLNTQAQSTEPEPVTFPIDSATGQVRFQQVVSLSSDMTVANIIQATRKWVAQSYKDANKVVQQYDPEGGLLVGKGYIPVNVTVEYKMFGDKQTTSEYYIHHTMTVEAKSGRCRITMDGFQIQVPPSAANPYISKAITDPQPFNVRECYVNEAQYKDIALKEMERLGYSGKIYTKNIDKQIPAQLRNARRRCEAVKRESLATMESLKQSLLKSSQESKW